MKCYLINLALSLDRLEYMASQFNRLGLQFVRVEAVNGRALSAQYLASMNKFSKHWPVQLSPAEIGCFLSHRKCLEQVAANEDAFGAIFEDDIRISIGASNLLSSDHWIPHGADIVKIDSYGHEVLISRPVRTENAYSITHLRSRHLQTGGYIVSKEAARKLLLQMNRVPAPVDHFLFDPDDGPFNELAIYQVTPAICRQSGLVSTIGSDRPRKKRPPFIGLMSREATRLVTRTRRNLMGLWVNATGTGRWGPIPYDSDIK